MIKRTWDELAKMIPGAVPVGGTGDLVIRGVSKDTRTIKPGMLYVPLSGQKFDGHRFVDEAMAKGAAASLWHKERPLPDAPYPLLLVDDPLNALQQLAAAYRSELSARVIGVTGSNGKTTTKELIASSLGTVFKVHKTEANLNTEIGLPLTLLEADRDTEVIVLEMGMRGRGQIELLSRIARPDAAVITNVGEAHLGLLGTREEIARAKLEILCGLREEGLFVYNGDNPLLEREFPRMPKPAKLVKCRFGADVANDLHPVGIMRESGGTRFTTNLDPSQSYYIPLFGQHNVINALAAIAVAKWLGASAKEIAGGLADVQLTGMRVEAIKGRAGSTIINDAYNASPTSTRAAIELLRELKGYSRKIAVLGDMLELGEEAERLHREIGHLLTPDDFSHVFTYGPLAQHIAAVAGRSFPPGTVRAYASKDELIRDLAALLKSGDVVLVKGSRGMQLEQVVEQLAEG